MKAEIKVVILEDDHVLAELLKERVNSIDHYTCVGTFNNPVEFLSKRTEADIILLDIVMPKMSGIDAIEPILEKLPDVAIIMNTIKDDPETIFKALQKGALGYIDKQSYDVNFEEVLNIVAEGGAYMTPKIARIVFNSFQKPKVNFELLTRRETDVTNGILEGLSYKMIALKYNISIDTVRMNIRSIYKKLKINSKGQLFNMVRSK